MDKQAHCLNYDAFSTKWVQALETSEEVKTVLDRHFKECAERFAEDVPEWEVTNETLVLYPQPNRETKFLKEEDFVSWSFDKARQYFKNNKLIINGNHETVWEQFIGYRSAYYMQIKQELEKGTPIDAIGLQCHIFYKRDEEEKWLQSFIIQDFFNSDSVKILVKEMGNIDVLVLNTSLQIRRSWIEIPLEECYNQLECNLVDCRADGIICTDTDYFH